MHLGRLLALVALTACSNTVTRAPSPKEGDGVGGGPTPGPGAGGVGGKIDPPEPAVEKVWAPDQTSVRVAFTTDLGPAAPTVADVSIGSSEVAALEVVGAAYDPIAAELVITTGKQKLGATYELSIQGTGVVDGPAGSFLAADTARFWAVDFSSFEDYEVAATRVGVGKTGVVYVEEGWDVPDVDYVLERFDTEIYPIETATFGAASDVDENHRIVLLGLDGDGAYGGYFSPINTLSDDEAIQTTGYHSNETDMLYLDVPQFGSIEVTHVVPHEFSHLLYHSTHGFELEDWAWHNEGMAECAVHVVNGSNEYAVQILVADPTGELAAGLSFVNWQYGNYAQYALAYHVLTYLAAQGGGVSAYADIFALDGHPSTIDAWGQMALGKPFADVQRDFYVALWTQAPSGPYGFSGMIDFFGKPQPAPSGHGPWSLEPYSGIFVSPISALFFPPGTQGPSIVYAGIDLAGTVDLDEPYSVSGGMIVVTNVSGDLGFSPEPAGVDTFPAPANPRASWERDRAWLHPPPFDPGRLERSIAWRDRTR